VAWGQVYRIDGFGWQSQLTVRLIVFRCHTPITAAIARMRAKLDEFERAEAFKARFGREFNKRAAKHTAEYLAEAVPTMRKAGNHVEADLLEKYGPQEIARKRQWEREHPRKSHQREGLGL
jgi:hypothetical protein